MTTREALCGYPRHAGSDWGRPARNGGGWVCGWCHPNPNPHEPAAAPARPTLRLVNPPLLTLPAARPARPAPTAKKPRLTPDEVLRLLDGERTR
ncbi:MAG TPA: hypothetical protein VNM48_01340 [Chloroflexota bacterium]|nr:hypothetical protein [Chloroflexota bacterium]